MPEFSPDLEAAVAAYESRQEGGNWLLFGAFMPTAWLSVVLWLLGRPREALERNRLVFEIAEQQQYPLALAYGQCLTAWLHQYRGDAAAVKQYADAAIETSRTHDYAQWLALGFMFRSWALVALGEHETGLAHLTRGIEKFRGMGAELNVPHFLALLADAHRRTGNPVAGLKVIDEAIAIAAKNDDRCWEPELHRLRGELLLLCGDACPADVGDPRRAAESAFRTALDVAVRQKSRSLEVRVALSLARLLTAQTRFAEARSTLATALDHHPRGGDTSELEEARAALADLEQLVATNLERPSVRRALEDDAVALE